MEDHDANAPVPGTGKKLKIAVAIAIKPQEFNCGRDAPDGSEWELFGEYYKENPKYDLPEEYMEMVRLWMLFDREAGGFLPESGGSIEQAAIMMEAFGIMTSARSQLQKKNH